MDEAFGHWLAGFIDGEGFFQLYEAAHKRTYAARFNIKLRDDDRPVLRMIQATLGGGRIYQEPGFRAGASPVAIYRLTHITILKNTLVPLLERCPLRAKKQNDFEVWKKAVAYIYDITQRPRPRLPNSWGGTLPRWTDEDRAYLGFLKQRLQEVRTYDPELAVVESGPVQLRMVN